MLHARVYEIEDCCFKIQMTLMWLTNSVTIGDWCAFPIVLQALCVCVCAVFVEMARNYFVVYCYLVAYCMLLCAQVFGFV